jgi:hypothetical protein
LTGMQLPCSIKKASCHGSRADHHHNH